MNYSSRPKLIAVVGTTATGKTPLGVELALELGGEVVNADSRLFYRGMDVATAKPTKDETKGIPHHLIDFLAPDDQYSLADYLKKARSAKAKSWIGVTYRSWWVGLANTYGQSSRDGTFRKFNQIRLCAPN